MWRLPNPRGLDAALPELGGVLCVAFLINEAMVRQPWAHINVLFSRNIGLINGSQPVDLLVGRQA